MGLILVGWIRGWLYGESIAAFRHSYDGCQ